MKYWLHRISHEAATSWPLLEKGILTIGFSGLSNAEFLAKALALDITDLHELDSDVENAYGRRLRQRHNLWRFLKRMQVDDWVLVPGYRVFSVYVVRSEPKLIGGVDPAAIALKTRNGEEVRCKDDLLEVGEKVIDLGFYREVEVHRICGKEMKNISRFDYADRKLTARMKIYHTNSEISELEKSVNDALNAFGKEKRLTLNSHIAEATAEQLLKAIYARLEPDQKFERLLEWYFERLGGTAKVLPKNQGDKEGDCDVTATFEHLRLTIHVQAKMHDPESLTGHCAVKQITEWAKGEEKESSPAESATALWVVSTCKGFTSDCVRAAEEAGVVLINGIDLARMLLYAGVDGLEL